MKKPLYSLLRSLWIVLGSFLLLLSPLCSINVPVVDADLGSYWLSGYGYRKAFNVTGKSRVQFNYVTTVMVHYGNGTDSGNEIYLNGHVSKSFRDVRFANNVGGLLKAQRAFRVLGDRATFLVTIPILPAAPNNATLYVYYDNPKVFWEKYEDVIFINDPTKEWENYSVRSPSIVWNGTHYCMFYGGHKYGGENSEGAIGLASSTDGISWTRENDGDPVLSKTGTGWEGKGVGTPTVLYIDGTYHMWYCGTHYSELDSFGNHRARAGYANSKDGTTWTRGPNNPILEPGAAGKFDDEDVGWYMAVILDDNGNYTMLYVGYDGNFRTGAATSATPWKDWIKLNAGNPVLSSTEAWEMARFPECSVRGLVQIDGTYYAAYVAGSGRWNVTGAMNLGLAKSTDRIKWIKHAANPVLETWDNHFDRTQIQDPVFVKMQDTGKWRIYYTATDGSAWEKYTITFAETDLIDHPPFLSDFDLGYWYATIADVDCNGKLDVADQRLVQKAMFTVSRDSRWNPNADIDGDLDVDVGDQRIQQLYIPWIFKAPKLFVDPPSYSASALGENFTIGINIAGVQDLWAFEFRLAYNTTLLKVLKVDRGAILPKSASFSTIILDAENHLTVQAYYFGAEAVNGRGTLATITFNVTYPHTASCVLDLYKTVLLDNAYDILHNVEDGYFEIEVIDQRKQQLPMFESW